MEEAVQMVGSMARAGVEISVELLKILAPLLVKGAAKILTESGKLLGFGIKAAAAGIANARAEGTVSRKNLLAAAARENSEVKFTDNFPSDVTERLVEKAKEYKIPVAVNGSGASRSISYLERDTDVFAQVLQDWQAEQLNPETRKGQGITSFEISEKRADLMKSQLEQNGVECWFTRDSSGGIRCNFKTEDAPLAESVTNIFRRNQQMIEEKCVITPNAPDIAETERQLEINARISKLNLNLSSLREEVESEEMPEIREVLERNIRECESQIESLQGEYEQEKIKAYEAAEIKSVTVTNEANGKNVEVAVGADLHRSEVTDIFREELGYSTVQAELAANKLADNLGLDYTQPTQEDFLDKMQVNIRYPSDDASIRDFSFSAVKFKDGENVHIAVGNGDDSVLITPAELSDEELKSVFTEQLGMTENQAEKCVAKSRKIDAQIQNKLRETVYERADQQRSVSIERTSQNSFIVKSGEVTKSYDFSQVNLEEKISEDFKIPAKNAHNVVQKAQNQSAIQNKIRDNSERKRRSAKLKSDPLKEKNFDVGKKMKR